VGGNPPHEPGGYGYLMLRQGNFEINGLLSLALASIGYVFSV
jgi:hypothetical protein